MICCILFVFCPETKTAVSQEESIEFESLQNKLKEYLVRYVLKISLFLVTEREV